MREGFLGEPESDVQLDEEVLSHLDGVTEPIQPSSQEGISSTDSGLE